MLGRLIHPRDWPVFRRLMADYRAGKLSRPSAHGTRRPDPPSPRVVMLLEDLHSGETAEAAVLVPTESTEMQLVEGCGFDQKNVPQSAQRFRLVFDGHATEPLDYDVIADDMQAALVSLPNLSDGDVLVQLGPGASAGSRAVLRWLVLFTGQFAARLSDGADVPLLEIAAYVDEPGDSVNPQRYYQVRPKPDHEDSGETVAIHCPVPLPPDVVIPAGTIGTAHHYRGWGYAFPGVECRDCESDIASLPY